LAGCERVRDCRCMPHLRRKLYVFIWRQV
jgi:hypothetical protein